MLRPNEGDLMNQDPLTHWVMFLTYDVLLNIFPLELLISIGNMMDYIFIVK